MQILSDCTKEELMKDSDPLFLTHYPIGKIKMFADLIWGIDEGELETGNVFNGDNKHVMSGLLKDSCREIEFIVNTSNEIWRKDIDESRIRKKILEQILEDIRCNFENPGKALDLKALSENIRKHL